MTLSYPLEFVLGPFRLNAHLFFEALGFFLGYRYYLALKQKRVEQISNENRMWILIAAAFGALVGSRLVGALENPHALRAATIPLLYIYQQKTILGGLLGGLLIVELMKVIIGEKESSGDLFVFPLILGMCIGRVGCFSQGIYEATYGLPTDIAFGMNLGDGLKRHPVSLYEIGFLLILWVALYQLMKKERLHNGMIFKLFLIAYCLFRFFLDFLKPHYDWPIGFSTIQIASSLGLLYYSIILTKNYLQTKTLRSSYD